MYSLIWFELVDALLAILEKNIREFTTFFSLHFGGSIEIACELEINFN